MWFRYKPDGSCPENGIVKLLIPAGSVAAIQKLKQETNWNKT